MFLPAVGSGPTDQSSPGPRWTSTWRLIVLPRGPVIVVSRSTVWPIDSEPETNPPIPKTIRPKSLFILIIALPSL